MLEQAGHTLVQFAHSEAAADFVLVAVEGAGQALKQFQSVDAGFVAAAARVGTGMLVFGFPGAGRLGSGRWGGRRYGRRCPGL